MFKGPQSFCDATGRKVWHEVETNKDGYCRRSGATSSIRSDIVIHGSRVQLPVGHRYAAIIGKLFTVTCMSFCHQAVQFGTYWSKGGDAVWLGK